MILIKPTIDSTIPVIINGVVQQAMAVKPVFASSAISPAAKMIGMLIQTIRLKKSDNTPKPNGIHPDTFFCC